MRNGSREARASALAESRRDRLRRSVDADAMSVELVSAYAGDRAMTSSERASIAAHMSARGSVFFSDLLYAISHHYVAPGLAEVVWSRILQHKLSMSATLGRDVRITVATLDYLSNVMAVLTSPRLISEAYAAEIAALSMRDGMTGLYNHTSCYELLEQELRNHRRYGQGVSLILIDIDDFKRVNDRHGHQEGDRILIELAKTITAEVRESDMCCRFGGEEFAAILPSTLRLSEANEIAERIRRRTTTISCGEESVTISLGIATCDHTIRSARDLVEMADRALYRAKNNGKNRIAHALPR
jgi:diguanylate cyclase (GGDEF)-like protein